jgi:hypothetical protein
VVALTAWRLHSAFRATPANFPVPQPAPPPRIPAESLRMGYRKEEERNDNTLIYMLRSGLVGEHPGAPRLLLRLFED